MEREKAIVKVSVVGIGVNAVLVAFKLAVGFISDSNPPRRPWRRSWSWDGM